MSLCRNLSVITLAASCLFPAAAVETSAPATAKAVAADARQRIQKSDFLATGRLVQVAADGARKSYNFTFKAKWFPDGLHMLCEITTPAESRMRLLLTIAPNGRETIEIGKPGEKAPKALPFDHWGDKLLDTLFTYEDLADSQFFWENQTLLPDAKYGARDCQVLKSEPGSADRTHYASVTSWIDKRINATVHVEKTARNSSLVKQFVYHGMRESNGQWSAAQIEAKVEGSTGSSLLIIERGSANARLERKAFDPSLLIKP